MIRRVFDARPKLRRSPDLPGLDDPSLRGCGVEEAFRYCEEVAQTHFENYPVATRFVPPQLRPHVWAIYAFARAADDFTDEPRYAGRREELLAFWEGELERAYHGEAEHPVFIALKDTVEHREVPITPLRDLLTSYAMDLSDHRYSTYAALEQYCAHAALPVGRLVLYVFGYRDPALHQYADAMCTALQLTHICRDVALDAERDRIYLPQEDLQHFGVSEAELRARRGSPAFRDLMRFQVARARALYERGRPLLERVGRDLGFELSLLWHGGTALLDKIEAADHDVLRRRPQLNGADKARIVARAAAQRWPTFIGAASPTTGRRW